MDASSSWCLSVCLFFPFCVSPAFSSPRPFTVATHLAERLVVVVEDVDPEGGGVGEVATPSSDHLQKTTKDEKEEDKSS